MKICIGIFSVDFPCVSLCSLWLQFLNHRGHSDTERKSTEADRERIATRAGDALLI